MSDTNEPVDWDGVMPMQSFPCGDLRIPDGPIPVKDEAGNVIGGATVTRDGDDWVVRGSISGDAASAIMGDTVSGVSIGEPDEGQ